MSSLEEHRKAIDKIDEEIVRLLNERAKAALKIARLKSQNAQGVFSPERERDVRERLKELNEGPLPEGAIEAVYREIISATRALQSPTIVAYLGPPATFTHIAAHTHFGSSAQFLPVSGIPSVFEEVERGRANYGVVPIENSTEGVVNLTLDMFMDSALKINSEITMRIPQHLLSRHPVEEIRRIYSHRQPIAQCRKWLTDHLSDAEQVEVTSTSLAVQKAAEEEHAAAIGSEMAAETYDVPIAVRDIQDNLYNFTRFFCIGNEIPSRTGKDRTSIMFSIRHKPGALFHVLQPFSDSAINLTKIESRPSKKKPWEYVFFVDMEGHCEDDTVKELLDKLADNCLFLKVLGSYPRGDEPAPP